MIAIVYFLCNFYILGYVSCATKSHKDHWEVRLAMIFLIGLFGIPMGIWQLIKEKNEKDNMDK